MGKLSTSAILAAFCRSVQLPREPPTETRGGGGEAAAVLSEKGKKTTRGRGCLGWATR